MNDRVCPECGSTKIRRGGTVIWTVYMGLIAVAVPAVLVFHLHPGLVGGIVIAAIAAAHLIVGTWACRSCGAQFKL